MAGDFDLSPDDYAEDLSPSHRIFRYPPGSFRAIREGCLCPRISNQYGHGTDLGNDRVFTINPACQYHLPAPPPAESGE